MKVCLNCGATNEAFAKFCQECGSEIRSADSTDPLTSEVMEKALKGIEKARGKRRMSGKNAKVALWGPASSGKTTYLVSIFGAGIQSDSGWIVRPGDRMSTDFVLNAMSKLKGEDDLGIRVSSGEFPSATENRPEPTYYKYFFAPGERSEDESDGVLESFWKWLVSESKDVEESSEGLWVSFADVAGEQYLRDSIDDPLWAHLAQSDGLICLLDPAHAGNSFRVTVKLLQTLWLKLLEETPHSLHRHKLPHQIAFCFTKMDRSALYSYIDRPRDLLEQLSSETGAHLNRLIDQYVLDNRIEYFGVSSIGVDAEREESLVDEESNNIPEPEKIQPINILEPLRWLFNRLYL